MNVSTRACAICGKPQTDKFKPFCSARCADIDLNRWLKGTYVVPGKPLGEEDEAESTREDDAV